MRTSGLGDPNLLYYYIKVLKTTDFSLRFCNVIKSEMSPPQYIYGMEMISFNGMILKAKAFGTILMFA